MLANRLEEAILEMENMVSKEEVEKMEFMFSDTVTRLSTRVVQLENKQKSNERSAIKALDDCGGALDFDAIGRDASNNGQKNSSKLQPGGRVRPPNSDSSSAQQGLMFSASTESMLGGTGKRK
jgi:hypothetical protein